MNNVCNIYHDTGYFYENYNKRYEKGEGSDAHPFTGWTATVALIIDEYY